MHEFSIVQSLMQLIEQQAVEHGARRVTRVVVKIGKFSGVEPHLLKTAFDTFKAHSIAETAELDIQLQELELRCQVCGHTFQPQEMRFICPSCQSREVTIIQGQEMMLMSLEMETEPSDSS